MTLPLVRYAVQLREARLNVQWHAGVVQMLREGVATLHWHAGPATASIAAHTQHAGLGTARDAALGHA